MITIIYFYDLTHYLTSRKREGHSRFRQILGIGTASHDLKSRESESP